MMEIFVHPNNCSPKLWAADANIKKVIFGSLIYGVGRIQEKFVSGDISVKIKQKLREGYEHIGQVKKSRDVISLIEVFNEWFISTPPTDPAGVLRCAEMIIKNDYPGINQWQAMDALEPLKAKLEQETQSKPEQEPQVRENLLIITQSTRNDDWSLII